MNEKIKHFRENKENVDYVLKIDKTLKNPKYVKVLDLILDQVNDKTLKDYFDYTHELIRDLEHENNRLRKELKVLDNKVNIIIRGLNER